MNEGVKKNNKKFQTWYWNLPHSGMIHLHNEAIVQYLKIENQTNSS